MQAVWYEKAGAAADVLQFGERPDPEPAEGEVRVKIAWSAVNPTDDKRRQNGREIDQFDYIIPNNDGSGVIDAVGDGVDNARVGERVWIFSAQAGRPFGTAADYVALPSRQAIRLPDSATLEDGACLGVPAVTAHRALFADGPIEGQTVVITGAAGRVNRYTVQMAKRAGAEVIATVGSDEKAEHVRGLGADHILDYKTDDIVAEVLRITDRKGVHRLVDVEFGANIGEAPKMMRPNGVITSFASGIEPNPTLPFYALMYTNITIRPLAIFGMPRPAQDEAIAHVTECLEAGALQHLVGRRVGLDDMVAAHEAIAAGAVFGCLLVEVDPGLEG